MAITTAPRKIPTLTDCVESLAIAGWENPLIFAEPGSPIDTALRSSSTIYHNSFRHGVWDNWRKSCHYALERAKEIGSELIMTVQDDVDFHPESREFVERTLWPHSMTGYISLYTPKHYQLWKDGSDRPKGMYHVNTRSMWGAVAMVWHAAILERLVNHRDCSTWVGCPIKRHKKESRAEWNNRWLAKKQERIENRWMIQNSDTVIGKIVRNRMKRRMMYFNPSLCSHFATTSACGHGGNDGRRNALYIADHSLPLDHQIPLPKPVELKI